MITAGKSKMKGLIYKLLINDLKYLEYIEQIEKILSFIIFSVTQLELELPFNAAFNTCDISL